jgi:hypothetical protein
MVYIGLGGGYGRVMPSTLTAIRDATDRVQDADTQLEELTAMVELQRLVRAATQQLIMRALHTYSGAEVARATGVTRQATNRQKLRRQSAKKGPAA